MNETIWLGQTYKTTAATWGHAGLYIVPARVVSTHIKFGVLYEGDVLPEGQNEKAYDASLNPWRFYDSELVAVARTQCLNCKEPAVFDRAQCEKHLVNHRRTEREGMRRRHNSQREVTCSVCHEPGHNRKSHLVGEP